MQPQQFHIQPRMDVGAYKTYALVAPPATHHRKATCEEVECPNNLRGWRTVCDVGTVLGQRQAEYITKHSGRRFVSKTAGTVITYTFGAGQQCFAPHTVPVGREPLYIVRGGDWRGNPTGERRQHVSAADWVEDFGEHQQRITDEIEKG